MFSYIDCENWWDQSNLWNFFDKNGSNADSYNPNNVYNVERWNWDISSSVQIGWRNWGSQIRVIPQQNILSKQVLNAYLPILTNIINYIANWYVNILKPLKKEYLLTVIKLGWEAGVEYNAYYYPNGNQYRLSNNISNDPTYGLDFSKYGLSGGLPLLGYAAANSSGLFKTKIKNNETLDRYDISNITQFYINTLIQSVINRTNNNDSYNLNNINILINDGKFGNHVGGQYYPYNETVPFAAGFANSKYNMLPGWSFYDTIPQNIKQLIDEMNYYNRSNWIAAEWWLDGGNNTQLWYYNFNQTLSFFNCQSFAVYNWDNSFENNPYAIKATKQLLNEF